MPFILWINEIFPESQAPYTVKEIITRLHSLYSSKVDDGRVYRALSVLSNRPATAEIVKPLDDSERYRLYSARAARLIARRATHGLKPEHLGFDERELKEAQRDEARRRFAELSRT